jgi:hypothetical protein
MGGWKCWNKNRNSLLEGAKVLSKKEEVSIFVDVGRIWWF